MDPLIMNQMMTTMIMNLMEQIKMKQNWRQNIKNIDDLNDLDPMQILVHMRHVYLECAKDMATNNEEWNDLGEESSLIAEQIQGALEVYNIDQERMRN